MPISRIIFWQPFASPHQEAFLEAVAEQFTGEVILGVELACLPPERVVQGWREPRHDRVRVIDVSKPDNHAALTAHRFPDSLHVFTGFFSHPLVWSGFHKLADSQARLAIYSESPEQTPLTGWLKRARGRLLAARWAKRFAFVLAVGGVGCEFFERIGFPKEKIVPFGYYLPVPPLPSGQPERPCGDVVRIVSAGQLVHRKGVDLLIEACAALPQAGCRIDIYGSGPEQQRLERLVECRHLSDIVLFHGMATNPEVQDALAVADCAVVPSRFDGWAALVSESLAVGTPTICTETCGAASLLKSCGLASSIVAPTAAALAKTLRQVVARGPVTLSQRLAIHSRVIESGSPATAAALVLSLAT